ncbi:MAG: hypothetical protein ACFCVG_10615 [Kineosporiaceae bacterium]
MGIPYEDEDGNVHNVQPEQLRAAYDQVEVTLDTIRDLATQRMSEAIGDVGGVRSRFLGMPGHSVGGTSGLFGDTDEGRLLDSAHGAALDVFTTAVQEIETRLVDMQTGLLQVLASYESTDADASEVLNTFVAEQYADSASPAPGSPPTRPGVDGEQGSFDDRPGGSPGRTDGGGSFDRTSG